MSAVDEAREALVWASSPMSNANVSDAIDTLIAAVRADTIDGCVNIIQQSLDTVRAEAGDLPSGKVGIAARQHSIDMLNGWKAALERKP